MNNKTPTIIFPKWIKEVTPNPSRYVKQIFRNLAFLKIKEYERQLQPFQAKYKMSFEQFEEKVKSQKKENFEIWDDYLIWKGLHLAHQKWLKRYI
ncbi:hypothetical protein KAU40_02120 [Candidatus Parcubacteria bacterium]|nr:hypothetical protein [Candidatus Parcubacteria bacterium]